MKEKKAYLKDYGNATCPICGKEFEKARKNQVYCSKDCKKIHDRKLQVDYMRRRYNGDPEFRKTVLKYKRDYYEKNKAKKNA